MYKKLAAAVLSLLMLAGCAANNTDTAGDTIPAEATEAITEAAAEETEASEEFIEEDMEEEISEYEPEIFVNDEIPEYNVEDEIFEDEVIEDEVEEIIDISEKEKIGEALGGEYDMSNFTCSGYFERGGAKLISFSENADNPTSLVIHCKADGTIEPLYAQQGPVGTYAKAITDESLPDYQNFDHTIYIMESIAMGNGQPILTWHLTEDGNVIDLADTIDFEVQFEGLFIGDVFDGENYMVEIGLREQIPGTTAVGDSMVIPVTLDENGKIVKVDPSLYSLDSEPEAVKDHGWKNREHDWENIDYSIEYDEMPESGRTIGEEIPFYDYALDVMEDKAIVEYFKDNSKHFAEFMDYTSYYAAIGCIYGDFDKDGEEEYLAEVNYGRGYRNDVAIVDNGEVVFWGTADNGADDFAMVCVGRYLKGDPYRLTNDDMSCENFDEYIRFIYTDYFANEDNIFIGSRVTTREALNFYYRINYDKEKGYSIEHLRTVGWVTNNGEDEDGNIIGREFYEEKAKY
ncbi:MAG: hypothetical protein ACI4KF_03115 [Huintestinicola sp.]